MTPGQTQISDAGRSRVLVIRNPRSGQGESGLFDFVRQLEAAGLRVTLREIRPGMAVAPLLTDAEQFRAVVAAGGDGTVSGVAYALRYRPVPLLAYPAGTANLIAQNLELPRHPARLAQVLLAGQVVKVDLGEIDVQGQKSGFCMLAGAGADATMIKDSDELKEKFGEVAYVLSALKQINPRKTTFQLVIDGQPRRFEGIGVMVANFGRASYRMPITSDISPNDGRLTVILLRADHVLRLLPNLVDSLRVKLKLGDPLFSGNLETVEAREVTVSSAEPFPLQYDGELHVETTPFTARILPGAIQFLTSVPAAELRT